MTVIGILILLFLVFVVASWLTFSLMGFALTLLVAGFVGWLADRIVPGSIPYGWLGAIVAGLAGAWIGGWFLGNIGPHLFGIALIPALVGAVILAIIVNLIGKLGFGGRV
jgi:uncharacterized membrane protein YeaQ/YmgE (transglycosylase-associated protein family)